MKIFLSALFLFTTFFLTLVVLVDGSNDLIEMQRDFLKFEKEKERLSHQVTELEYIHTLNTAENTLLRLTEEAQFSHLEFPSSDQIIIIRGKE